MILPLSRRMTASRRTAAQCRPLYWVSVMAPDSEAVWKMQTVLPMLIWVMNPWQVDIPMAAVLPVVPIERPVIVAVAHVPEVLAAVPRLQPREQMPVMRMLAGRLP